ncbi:MAG: hypothetical protein M3439_12350 [Chloroflexota bacterium]|nr:hypothetical protein [Chloroflexota bacterium]
MEFTLRPGRPVAIVAAVVAAGLALIPFTALAAGVDANTMIEACRSFMGSFAGAMPCGTS